jgi:hypothetical protein
MQESNPDGPTMISLLKNDSVKIGVKIGKVQTEEEALASSATMMGPSSLFLYG